MKKDIECSEEDIKPKLRRKPTELDSDDDEDTVDDVKPLKQVFIEMAGTSNEMKRIRMIWVLQALLILRVLLLNHRKLKLVFNHQLLPQR